LQEKREIRDDKEYTVTVLDEREGLPFYCFACKRTLPHNQLSRSETHKYGNKSWFLCEGCDWQREKHTPKEQDGDMSRFHKTKFPFPATINGKPVVVHQDRIEHLEPDDPPPWWFNYSQPDEETEQAWANWEEEADA